MNEITAGIDELDVARRAVVLPDDYVLQAGDDELVSFVLGSDNYICSTDVAGRVTYGALGSTFTQLGALRSVAREHPQSPVEEEPSETVGLELFGNMLDTIAFLRVRLRALADALIDKGVIDGPSLLGRYHESHERSFVAFRDLMLLRPEVFEKRFAEWLATENSYREKLASQKEV